MARKNYPDDFKRDAVALYRDTEDATITVIAAELGVSEATLSASCKAAGVAIRATVIDCCSRRVTGSAIAEHMRTELVEDALNAAAALRGSLARAVFHSDHGCQYTSEDFATLCGDLGVIQSMVASGRVPTMRWPNRSAPPSNAKSCKTATAGPTRRPAAGRSSGWLALVRAGAVFHKGKPLERPTDITAPQPHSDSDEQAGTEVA
jgi:transposase-like protein